MEKLFIETTEEEKLASSSNKIVIEINCKVNRRKKSEKVLEESLQFFTIKSIAVRRQIFEFFLLRRKMENGKKAKLG